MNNIQHHYNQSSFSSSLLEEIYRSIDKDRDGGDIHHHSDSSYRRMKMKMDKSNCCYDLDPDRFRVNKYVLGNWMDKNHEKKIRRNSMPEDGKSFRRPPLSSSSTSSSDSSSGIFGFSSDDIETPKPSKKKMPTLKPIRTAVAPPEMQRNGYSDEIPATKKKSKKDGKLQLQQRALKLYGDLKKVKQPISPGGKLASFLNSLFHSSASKKPKIEPASSSFSSFRPNLSASTPSSNSRSCLSKTPSSAGRFERRSVRFFPVSVIVDEDCRPCGEKPVYNDDVSKIERVHHEELKVQIMEKHRRVEEVAKELLKNYHKKYSRDDTRVNVVNDHGIKKFNNYNNNDNDIKMRGFEDEDEDDDEDEESCCSSDLFELDNLLEIGVDDRYREELPVYETTHVGTNRAIANGFIL